MSTLESRVSVIVPVYNESLGITQFHEALLSALGALGQERIYEILYIDDGSADDSLSILRQLPPENCALKILSLSPHAGKTEALQAGFTAATGDIIVTIDADLQNDPRDIARLVKGVLDGSDMVIGWRQSREDGLSRHLQSALFNLAMNSFMAAPLHDANCGFKAFRAEVARSLPMRHEWHRFHGLIAAHQGFHITEIPVQHYPRAKGRSKYGIGRALRFPFDLCSVLISLRK